MSTNGVVLDALGDWTRRQIFDALKDGPQSVGELAARMPVSRPAVSQHLRVLKDAGLVHRPQGRHAAHLPRRPGRAAPGSAAYFDSFWDEALERFAAAGAKGAG